MRLRAFLKSLAQVRADWRAGRHYGYPRCCIAMFCWDTLWSVPPSLTRVVSQGVEPAGSTCGWVTCGVFHHGGSSLPPLARARRLASYWWHSLRASRTPQDRARPPWTPGAQPDPAVAPGPIEQAWAELDARTLDPELDWV
jgi:hypothetical protein